MTARRVVVKPRATRASAVAAQEIGRHAALVQKHILTRIVDRLAVPPVPPVRRDVSPPLFVRVYGFF